MSPYQFLNIKIFSSEDETSLRDLNLKGYENPPKLFYKLQIGSWTLNISQYLWALI